MSSPFLKLAIGGVVGIILIAMIGGIIGGGKTGVKEQAISLKLYTDVTLSMISNYQPKVKSSALRSSSASLYSVLSSTNNELESYITEKYSYKSGSESKKAKKEYEAHQTELSSTLFDAKITGRLDRIYAREMTYEISVIMNSEAKIINSSSDQTLKDLLTTSYESLDVLYSNFNDFSDIK